MSGDHDQPAASDDGEPATEPAGGAVAGGGGARAGGPGGAAGGLGGAVAAAAGLGDGVTAAAGLGGAAGGLGDGAVARIRASIAAQVAEDTFGGRFQIVAEAGSGGMGRVYEAIDNASGGRVAIKVIAALAGPDDRARFAAEAEVLERLAHPAIVHYVRHGVTTRGEPYLAMEWLIGESLAHRLARGPLSIVEAVTVGERMADALDHAHGAGVVHRDVKPSNIFLVGGEADHAHLIDFGIAKRIDHDLTHTGQMIGTPGYMAPEQARGDRAIDRRVDLFALGCVLYEALAGRAPFVGAAVMEVLARLLLDHPQPVEQLVLEVPPRLAHLIGSLLAKDPARRLADARIACRELTALREALAANDAAALALRPDWVPQPSLATLRDPPSIARRRPPPWRAIGAAGALALAAAAVAVIALRRAPGPVCDELVRTGCAELCKRGDAAACASQAEALHRGFDGAVDHEAGRVADIRACELGRDGSCVDAARSFVAVIRKEQLPPDDPRTRRRQQAIARLLTLACDRRHYNACRELGRQLSAHDGVLPADPPAAFALVEEACAHDNAAACHALLDMIDDPDAGTPALKAGAREVWAAACAREVIACP